MKDEEKFFEDRSILLGKLIDFIQLCMRIDRDPTDEVEEVVTEAGNNV